jgi:hypothetical protein
VQAKTNIRKYIDERLPEEYEKGLLEQIPPKKEAWITVQSTGDKREKIHALTFDNQDSQQNAMKKVNELTIAQVKDIFGRKVMPNMPKFLDVHPLKDVEEETLRKAQKMPKDEFGITHDNMMYNKEEDRWYCLLDAPNKEAVEKHHQKAGITCEWIKEVKTTA